MSEHGLYMIIGRVAAGGVAQSVSRSMTSVFICRRFSVPAFVTPVPFPPLPSLAPVTLFLAEFSFAVYIFSVHFAWFCFCAGVFQPFYKNIPIGFCQNKFQRSAS